MLLKARPTTYNGIQMRSRLEARFAAELDEGGWNWQYEPRAFANQHGQYLPDFYLPEGNLFIEVRPTLEAAYSALERMAIIWASVPDAVLWVVVPDEGMCWAAAGVDRRWRVLEFKD